MVLEEALIRVYEQANLAMANYEWQTTSCEASCVYALEATSL